MCSVSTFIQVHTDRQKYWHVLQYSLTELYTYSQIYSLVEYLFDGLPVDSTSSSALPLALSVGSFSSSSTAPPLKCGTWRCWVQSTSEKWYNLFVPTALLKIWATCRTQDPLAHKVIMHFYVLRASMEDGVATFRVRVLLERDHGGVGPGRQK